MSSYRIVVWKSTYLSRYVVITPYMHVNTASVGQVFAPIHMLVYIIIGDSILCTLCIYEKYIT